MLIFTGNGLAPASPILKKLTTSTLTAYTPTTTAAVEDNNFGEFESRGESLLTLVEPELENLSRHWLAALKDHALLLLPPEYASQLPHDGGAFYTNDTMNSSKPHYLTAWPSILYAASLWLNSTKFEIVPEPSTNTGPLDNAVQQQSKTLNNNSIGHGSISADRFHLIFGISMEAICSTRSNEKLESIISCLQSIYTLFECEWPRQQLFTDRSLAVELCNVLHRQILTRDSLDVQLLCIEILKRTIQGANEELDRERRKRAAIALENDDGKTETGIDADTLGEGGATGCIVPGKSHAYAVLEVCLCLFVRQIPTMNPSSNTKLTTEHLQNQLRINQNGTFTLAEDNGMLVSSALQSLEYLTQLCSPKGISLHHFSTHPNRLLMFFLFLYYYFRIGRSSGDTADHSLPNDKHHQRNRHQSEQQPDDYGQHRHHASSIALPESSDHRQIRHRRTMRHTMEEIIASGFGQHH